MNTQAVGAGYESKSVDCGGIEAHLAPALTPKFATQSTPILATPNHLAPQKPFFLNPNDYTTLSYTRPKGREQYGH